MTNIETIDHSRENNESNKTPESVRGTPENVRGTPENVSTIEIKRDTKLKLRRFQNKMRIKVALRNNFNIKWNGVNFEAFQKSIFEDLEDTKDNDLKIEEFASLAENEELPTLSPNGVEKFNRIVSEKKPGKLLDIFINNHYLIFEKKVPETVSEAARDLREIQSIQIIHTIGKAVARIKREDAPNNPYIVEWDIKKNRESSTRNSDYETPPLTPSTQSKILFDNVQTWLIENGITYGGNTNLNPDIRDENKLKPYRYVHEINVYGYDIRIMETRKNHFKAKILRSTDSIDRTWLQAGGDKDPLETFEGSAEDCYMGVTEFLKENYRE